MGEVADIMRVHFDRNVYEPVEVIALALPRSDQLPAHPWSTPAQVTSFDLFEIHGMV